MGEETGRILGHSTPLASERQTFTVAFDNGTVDTVGQFGTRIVRHAAEGESFTVNSKGERVNL